MNELAGFGTDWLPASVRRRQLAEEAAERREARRAEQERADRAERLHDAAVAQYLAAAAVRGEEGTVEALVTGAELGRSVTDVLAEAQAAADREDARAAARERRAEYLGDTGDIGRSSDGWPSSAYEADRLIRQARDLHSGLVMARARRNYPAAVEAARAKIDPYIERVAAPGRDIWR